MLDAEGRIIYVGKARGLRSRVGSYFRADQLQPKVQALVRVIAGIEVTVTNSDTEALLLEHNLIKSHRPRFNVILRDDKSFPFVHLSAHEFPRLSFYRGSRKLPGRLFGPYPSASAVHETLNQLHKLFRLRSCKDTFFANRTRPCLEYQIGRCTAPCTGLIDAAAYARDVESACDGARRPRARRDGKARRGHGPRRGEARLRARRNAARPACGAHRRAGAPGRDAGARRHGHRRDRGGGAGRRVLRRAHVRARRAGARHLCFSPAGADQRAARGAVGVPGAALPRARRAAAHLRVARGRGRGNARRDVHGPFRAPGAHPHSPAWLSAAVGRPCPAECGERAADARGDAGRPRRAVRGPARVSRAGRAAFAHRVLRRQPYAGRGDERILRRIHAGRSAQVGLPALQHRRRRARRRLRRVAPGAVAPLPAAQAGITCRCPISC